MLSSYAHGIGQCELRGGSADKFCFYWLLLRSSVDWGPMDHGSQPSADCAWLSGLSHQKPLRHQARLTEMRMMYTSASHLTLILLVVYSLCIGTVSITYIYASLPLTLAARCALTAFRRKSQVARLMVIMLNTAHASKIPRFCAISFLVSKMRVRTVLPTL